MVDDYIEFGMQMYAAKSTEEWRGLARFAARSGFSFVAMNDHMGGQYSPLLGLLAVSMSEPSLRVLPAVLNASVRNPVITAKEVATMQMLTKGRFELGVGAGWQRRDFERSGIEFQSGSDRVEKLKEWTHIVRTMLTEGVVSFCGDYFSVENAECHPFPLQQRVPILIGGGSREILGWAGTVADIVGLDVSQRSGRFSPQDFIVSASAARFGERSRWVLDAARKCSRTVYLQVHIPAELVVPTRSALIDLARSWGVDRGLIEKSPLLLSGTPESMRDQILALQKELGVSRIVVPFEVAHIVTPAIKLLR